MPHANLELRRFVLLNRNRDLFLDETFPCRLGCAAAATDTNAQADQYEQLLQFSVNSEESRSPFLFFLP